MGAGMRVALLSDIHGNREALAAVLAHLSRRGADLIAVLGDVVGYGADPEAVTERVMALAEAGAVVLKGNHDAALDDPAPDMNAEALAAIRWTARQLSPDHKSFLGALPLTHRLDGALLVHASARQPAAWPYISAPSDAERSLSATDARLVFAGHTHVPKLFSLQPNGVAVAAVPKAGVETPLLAHRRWQIVLGAVGQPRDGDPAAAYAIFDAAQDILVAHRVTYDHEAAARRILAAGLPQKLAHRLSKGI